MMDYQYAPLNTARREIRLLEIVPVSLEQQRRSLDSSSRDPRTSLLKVKGLISSTGKRLGVSPSRPPPLECRIRSVSLDDEPVYETVSYCWGDVTTSRAITIEGRELKVPLNTDRALRRLALPGRSRVVWIDAVCINQDDLEERGSQVALMKGVYGAGAQNVVYLGEGDKFIGRAFANVRELMGEIERDMEGYRNFEDLLIPAAGQWRRSPTPLRTKLDHEALSNMWAIPWFSRVWVFQEQALSKRNLCISGSLQIDLDLILKVTTWLMNYHFTHIPNDFARIPGFRAAADMWLTRSDYIAHGRTDIYNTMGLAQGLGATDKRDKVFGLLGLLQGRNDGDNEEADGVHDLLKPDYSKTYQAVLRDAMRYALIYSQSPISILSSVGHRDETQLYAADFPSWVFSGEWEAEERATSLPRPGGGGGIDTSARTNRRGNGRGRASNGGDVPVVAVNGQQLGELDEDRELLLHPTRQNPSILTLRGFVMDTIRDSTAVFPTPGDIAKRSMMLPEWFDSCEALMPRPAPGSHSIPGDREDRLIRTLMGDVNAMGTKSTWQDRQGFYAFMGHIVQGRQNGDIQSPPQTGPNDIGGHGGAQNAAAHFSRALSKCQHRRFAVMESGFVGLVPKITRKGDVVVKFTMKGLDFPVVLRRRGRGGAASVGGSGVVGGGQRIGNRNANGNGESWWLVGECYVDGVMEWQEGWEGLKVWMERGPGRGNRRMFEIW